MGQIGRNENMCMVLLTFAEAFSLWSSTGSPDPFSIPCFLCHGSPDLQFPVSQGSQYHGPCLRGAPIPCSPSQDSFHSLFSVSLASQPLVPSLTGVPIPCWWAQSTRVRSLSTPPLSGWWMLWWQPAVPPAASPGHGQEVPWAVCKIPVNCGLNFSCAHQWHQRLIH